MYTNCNNSQNPTWTNTSIVWQTAWTCATVFSSYKNPRSTRRSVGLWSPLKPSEALWGPLRPSDALWRPLNPSWGLLTHLKPSWDLLRPLETSSDLLRSLEISCNLLRPLQSSWSLLIPLETSAELFTSLATSGDLLSALQTSWQLFRTLQNSSEPCSPLRIALQLSHDTSYGWQDVVWGPGECVTRLGILSTRLVLLWFYSGFIIFPAACLYVNVGFMIRF